MLGVSECRLVIRLASELAECLRKYDKLNARSDDIEPRASADMLNTMEREIASLMGEIETATVDFWGSNAWLFEE